MKGPLGMRASWRLVGPLLATLVTVPALPVASPAAPITLPLATRAKLGNGLTVIVMPTQRLPLVDFRLVARVGSVNDPVGKEGLAYLTATLLTQGAGARTARQFAADIEFVGGEITSEGGLEQTVVTCEVLKKDFDLGLEMFRDAIVRPTFAAEDFQREKEEGLGTIAADRDDPSTVADNALGPLLFGTTPLAHPPIGWEKSVTTIARDDVVAFHGRFVRPDNAILAVVGDVDPKAAISALEKAFSSWKGSAPKGDAYQPAAQAKGRQVLIVNKPEVTQTQVRMACMGVPRNHPDYYPIRVANSILSGGFTSRLVNEIRVNQGLTYSIRSGFDMHRNAGTYEIATFTRNETLRKLIDATLVEVKKLLDQGPTQAELDKAKRLLAGQYPLGLQAPDDLAARILDVEFYGLDPQFIQAFPDRIAAVTMDDCRRALKSYFCVEDLRILVVSNPETSRPALEGLGPIEVRDPQ